MILTVLCQPLNESDTSSIVFNAVLASIHKHGGGKPINAAALRALVGRDAAEFFRKPTQKRVLVTTLSIQTPAELEIQMLNVRISRVDRQTYPVPDILLSTDSYVRPYLQESTYCTIALETNEITSAQAVDRGLLVINCLRGAWNWMATFGSWSVGFSSVPKRKRLGVVHCGPIHTLHDLDGSLHSDMYWYDPDYIQDSEAFSPKGEWSEWMSNTTSILERLEQSPYKADMEDILARYAIALDQFNLDVSLLMLWSLLVKVTDTIGGNYDQTVKRACWPYKDRPVAKQLLNTIRMWRNQLVHSSASPLQRDRLCYMLKKFIDNHIRLLSFNPYKVTSLREYGEFLSLPAGKEELEVTRERLNLAIEMKTAR